MKFTQTETVAETSANLPLCIDCDGTLLRTDMLHESVFLLMKQSPLSLFLLPLWLAKGKAYLKAQIARRVRMDFDHLPVNEEVLALAREAREQGRQTVLVTASPLAWAQKIAARTGAFDEVIASDETRNVSGREKAERLCQQFGERKFEYVGNDRVDLEVWARSGGAIVVSPSEGLGRSAAQVAPVRRLIRTTGPGLRAYLRAARLHQWLKNLLVVVPVAAAHQLASSQAQLQVFLAFLAFSLCASAVYILNDLLDLESDRRHPRKRLRPFAALDVPLWHGVVAVPLLLAASVALAAQLPSAFGASLAGYVVLTCAYSFRLKRQPIVDVLLLAGLYTLRVIAGAAATSTTVSFWLLAFSIFVFLSLAVLKRYSELLVNLKASAKGAAGRGYLVEDLPVLTAIGVSAGMAAVMVLALYVNAPESTALYEHKWWLWLIPPLFLYWIVRVWLKAHRGQVDDDPVVFAAKDWQSWVAAFFLLGFVWLAR